MNQGLCWLVWPMIFYPDDLSLVVNKHNQRYMKKGLKVLGLKIVLESLIKYPHFCRQSHCSSDTCWQLFLLQKRSGDFQLLMFRPISKQKIKFAKSSPIVWETGLNLDLLKQCKGLEFFMAFFTNHWSWLFTTELRSSG